jgi:hypothetical protein
MPTAHSTVYPPWRPEESVSSLVEVGWVAEVEQDSHQPGVQYLRYCCCVSVNEDACVNVWKTPGNGDFEGLRGNL